MKNALLIVLLVTLFFSLFFISCEDGPTKPSDGNNGSVPGSDITLHADEGYVGIVINTRSILKKGYVPATASISFPNHSRFDTLIVIDPYTNLAILSIHRTELTEQDSTDFANGIAVNIVIADPTQQQLTSYSSNQKEIDDSNVPLDLETNLPFIPPTLDLNENLACLLLPENVIGVITSTSATEFSAGFFDSASVQQQFYLIRNGNTPNTYLIKHLGYASGEYLYYEAGQGYINLRDGDPDEFVLEPEEDGWLKIRQKNTGKFLFVDTVGTDRLRLNTTGMRFRIISDLSWEIEDLGTFYNQPVMGEARAIFAYSETLLNCSQGTLETEVGVTDARSTTWTYGTTESLQFFSSHELQRGFSIHAQVEAKIAKLPGSKITVGGEFHRQQTWTSSRTETTENTWTEQNQTSTEVSRVRTITVQPYSSVEIFDAVKLIDNVTIPYTQILRIRATDRRNSNTPLSGQEIVTQLFSNLTTTAIKQVRENFVDITLRGNIKMDRIMHAFTTVLEDSSACN